MNEVTLDARQERRVDLSMALASVQQTVEVSAEAAAINTENATIVNTMSNQEVTQLPANYRGASTSPLGAIVASRQRPTGSIRKHRSHRFPTVIRWTTPWTARPASIFFLQCARQQYVPFRRDARRVQSVGHQQ